MKRITTKYPGTCGRCGRYLPVGTQADWDADSHALYCTHCPAASLDALDRADGVRIGGDGNMPKHVGPTIGTHGSNTYHDRDGHLLREWRDGDGWVIWMDLGERVDEAKALFAELAATAQQAGTAQQAHKASCMAEAKLTGKPVVIESYMDDCDDPEEQCSLDAVTVLAMPDGTVTTTRQHTW
jgi:hypothetical protein